MEAHYKFQHLSKPEFVFTFALSKGLCCSPEHIRVVPLYTHTLVGFCDCGLLGCGGILNTTASDAAKFQGKKKCNGQASFFSVSTTAGLFLNLELIFRGSLLKQPEDHDKKIL